jgi:hypothetical protein
MVGKIAHARGQEIFRKNPFWAKDVCCGRGLQSAALGQEASYGRTHFMTREHHVAK